MNSTAGGGVEILIGPAPGVWNWASNVFLLMAGLFSDVLLIKLCLCWGFTFLFIHGVTGLPGATDGFAVDDRPRMIFVEMLVFSALNLFIHGFGCFGLLYDERQIGLRNEEEERMWRFFLRRSGMERLEFLEVIRRGQFLDFKVSVHPSARVQPRAA